MSDWFDRVKIVRDMRVSDAKLSTPEKFVLLMLATKADDDGSSFPSHRWLAERTGLARTTVIRAIQGLQAKGFIRAERRRDEAGDPTSNLYTVVASDHQVVASDDHGSRLAIPPWSRSATTVVAQGDGGGVPDGQYEHLHGALPKSSIEEQKEASHRSGERRAGGGKKKRGTPSALPAAPKTEDEKRVHAAYVEGYLAARGVEPAYNASATKKLLELGAAEACIVVRNAYADDFGRQMTISFIAKEPDRFRGRAPAKTNGVHKGAPSKWVQKSAAPPSGWPGAGGAG